MDKNIEYLENFINFHVDEVMESDQKRLVLGAFVGLTIDAIVSRGLDRKDQEIKKLIKNIKELIKDIRKTRLAGFSKISYYIEFSEIGYRIIENVQREKQLITDLIEAYKKLLELYKKHTEKLSTINKSVNYV